MSPQPLLVIVGATGVQGRSIATHYRTHLPQFSLLGLSRKSPLPGSPIPMAQADLLFPSSLDSAFASATHIFAYTDYAGFATSPQAAELVSSGEAPDLARAAGILERRAGENLADAAARVPTLERLVWSTTQDAAKWSGGKIEGVEEMQAKAHVWEYLKSKKGLEGKVSAVGFGVFVDVLVRFPRETFGWRRIGEGRYGFRVPVGRDNELSWIDMPADAGSWVQAAMEGPAGMVVEAIGGRASFEYIAGVIARKLGVEVEVESIDIEEYAKGDDSGIMRAVGLLFQWVEGWGVGGGDPEFLDADELAKRGLKVQRSDIKEVLERMDWSHLLEE